MWIRFILENRTDVALKRIFSRRNYQKHLTPIFINRSTVFSFFGNYFQLDAQQLSVCPDSEKSFWDENYQKHLTPIFINCSTVFSFFRNSFNSVHNNWVWSWQREIFQDENYQRHLTPIFINCSTVISFFRNSFNSVHNNWVWVLTARNFLETKIIRNT